MVSALDPLRELYLLRRGQQVELADILEEELERIGLVVPGAVRLAPGREFTRSREGALSQLLALGEPDVS